MTSSKNSAVEQFSAVKNFADFSVFTTRKVISGADSQHTGKGQRFLCAGEFFWYLLQLLMTYLLENGDSRSARIFKLSQLQKCNKKMANKNIQRNSRYEHSNLSSSCLGNLVGVHFVIYECYRKW